MESGQTSLLPQDACLHREASAIKDACPGAKWRNMALLDRQGASVMQLVSFQDITMEKH